MEASKTELVITIDMQDDVPVVSWPEGKDCPGNPNEPCVKQDKKVRWELASDVAGRAWAVVFAQGSPFKKDQMVFTPEHPEGKLRKDATPGEYKYDVVLADANGNLKVLDPKIMVEEEEQELDEGYEFETMAYQLRSWSDDTDELVVRARELADLAERLKRRPDGEAKAV